MHSKVKPVDLNEPIRLSALGRDLNVGDLYDYHNDSVFPSLGSVQLQKQHIHHENRQSFDMKPMFLFQHHSLIFKCQAMGIKSHLIHNIEAGSLDVDQLWFGPYIETCQIEKEEEVKVDVYFRVIRRTETLDHHFLNSKLLKEYTSTSGGRSHIVEQVVYGAEFICSMTKRVDISCETKENARGSIYLAAKAYFDKAIGPNSTSITPPPELDNVSYTIYSSLLEVGNETVGSFQRSCELLRDAIDMGCSVRYIPYQLEHRLWSDRHFDLRFKDDEKSEMWKWIVRESRVPSNHAGLDRIPPLAKVLYQLRDLLKPLETALMKFKTNNPQEANISNLYVMEEITDWLIVRRKEIEAIAVLLKDTLLPMSNYEEILASNDVQKRTKVFVLNVQYVPDPLMEKIKLLTEKSHSFMTLPIFPIFKTGKKSISSFGKKLQIFSDEAVCHLMGPDPNTSYYIGLVTDSSQDDGAVTTFEYFEKTSSNHSPRRSQRNIQEHQNTQTKNKKPRPVELFKGSSQLTLSNEETEVHIQPNQRSGSPPRDEDMQSISSTASMGSVDFESQPDTLKKATTKPSQLRESSWPVGVDDILNEIQKCSINGGKALTDENENRTRKSSLKEFHGHEIQENSTKTESGILDQGKRIGEIFAHERNELSQLLNEGQPNIYMLNSKEVTIDHDLRWFHIGRNRGVPNHKVIILMGATGCGKSTLINGMINFILGVQWKDPFRFKCVREDKSGDRNQAHSQTSSVSAYTIYHHEGMAVPYSITIIDTPGYGDTRGVARDKEITQLIHRFLGQEESLVQQIHAACFVAASGDSRLTTTQRYILDSVLSIFGKDVKENIRLLVTFADNAVPPVVEACRVGNFPVTPESAGITYSKFNSSVLYASNGQQGDEDFSFDELFWNMGQEYFTNFFNMLEKMDGRDLTSTRKVIQCRNLLEQSLKSIESELEICLVNIENMELFRRKMRECGNKMENSKNFTIETVVFHRVKVNCDKGFHAYNCSNCGKTCEVRIKSTFFKKRPCSDQTCRCPETDHYFQPFEWRQVEKKVTKTLLDMKVEYQSHSKEKMTNEELLDKCSDELNLAKSKVFSLLDQVGNNARSLDSTALRSNALSPGDYLSLMKSRVSEEQKPGYMIRLETLNELQHRFQQQQASFSSVMPTHTVTANSSFSGDFAMSAQTSTDDYYLRKIGAQWPYSASNPSVYRGASNPTQMPSLTLYRPSTTTQSSYYQPVGGNGAQSGGNTSDSSQKQVAREANNPENKSRTQQASTYE